MYRTSRFRVPMTAVMAGALVLSACGDDSASPGAASSETTTGNSTSEAPTTTDTMSETTATTEMSETTETTVSTATTAAYDGSFDDARCEENKAAGKITFLTGYDFAAASSIVEVIYAKDQGLYEDLCLDVELTSSFSTANYDYVSAGTGTFASGGSFSEAAAFAGANEGNFQVVQVDGREPISTLLLKPGLTELESVKGKTIGVKGKLPPDVEVMLSDAGLTLGEDYETVLLDGFNPLAHYEIESIAGFPGWRSSEPAVLYSNGLAFEQFDVADAGIPGSFGVIIGNNDFISEHPTAAQDFVRATLKGLELAVADPASASDAAIAMLEATGNKFFLSTETETFRWKTEAMILSDAKPADAPIGTPDPDLLSAEIDAYEPTGLFDGITLPDMATFINTDLAAAISDGDEVIWPS